MRVIDARSGKEIRIGDTIRYPDGEGFRVLDIDEGLFSATAVVEQLSTPLRYLVNIDGSPVYARQQIPLQVRFFHPSYLFQKVAFIPS